MLNTKFLGIGGLVIFWLTILITACIIISIGQASVDIVLDTLASL